MAISAGAISEDDEDGGEIMATINTTPLVDVMLVLLIIFLITIPVVTHTIAVQLPRERVQPLQSQPQSIEVAVNRAGDVFVGTTRVDNAALLARLKAIAQTNPQPDVHVRGDQATPYAFIGRVVADCERAGLVKVAFITEPPARGH